jgi:hypothetical protein
MSHGPLHTDPVGSWSSHAAPHNTHTLGQNTHSAYSAQKNQDHRHDNRQMKMPPLLAALFVDPCNTQADGFTVTSASLGQEVDVRLFTYRTVVPGTGF